MFLITLKIIFFTNRNVRLNVLFALFCMHFAMSQDGSHIFDNGVQVNLFCLVFISWHFNFVFKIDIMFWS